MYRCSVELSVRYDELSQSERGTARKELGTSLALQYYAGHVGSGAGGDLV